MGPDGSLYIADERNLRVRRVSPNGIIDTVAGTGVRGYEGDGGPATQALLAGPIGVAVGADGSLYIADYFSEVERASVRRVGPDGIVTTVAGGVANGPTGDGGLATQARLISPSVVPVTVALVSMVGEDGAATVGSAGTFTKVHCRTADRRGRCDRAGG